MVHNYSAASATINMITGAVSIDKNYFKRTAAHNYYSIVWNCGAAQSIWIDDEPYTFAANSVLPLAIDQSYRFERANDFICWQFNTDFYCVANHDAEVGCVGYLFYGLSAALFIDLDEVSTAKMQQLSDFFIEEFSTEETIKQEMLRILLVKLIIQVTRLAKKQFIGQEIEEEKFNLLRQYNFLVDSHYKQEKQVQFYAQQLHRSPKTIANIFSLYSKKTPLQIIHERVTKEAKRLLHYTDKSVKEVAYDLGFEDAANFSKFFKHQTAQNPSELKKQYKKAE